MRKIQGKRGRKPWIPEEKKAGIVLSFSCSEEEARLLSILIQRKNLELLERSDWKPGKAYSISKYLRRILQKTLVNAGLMEKEKINEGIEDTEK